MSNLDFHSIYSINDVSTTFSIRELQYGMVEFTISRRVLDEEGFVVEQSDMRMYPSVANFKEMMLPLVNHLKDNYDGKTSN
jgi:hypothetical protein